MDDPLDSAVPTDPPPPPPQVRIPVARPVLGLLARPAAPADPMLLENVSRLRAAANLLLLAGAAAWYVLGVSAILGLTGASSAGGVDAGTAISVTVAGGVLLAVTALLLTRGAGCRLSALGLSRRELAVNLLWGLMVTVCSFAVFFAIVGIMMVAWPQGYGELADNKENIKQILPSTSPLLTFVLMAVIGAYEEILFRGMLLTHLRRLSGSWIIAVTLVAAVFAAMHLPNQQAAAVIPLAAVAVVWAGFTIWRRSLVPAIVGHVLFNLIQVLALRAMG